VPAGRCQRRRVFARGQSGQYRGVHGTRVEELREGHDVAIRSSTPGKDCGFIAEPVQGYGGVIPLAPGYMKGAV